MQKITSAYANKMLRSLEEDKAFWVNKEAVSSTYVAAVNEEPVIQEYDYMTVANTIDEIDDIIYTPDFEELYKIYSEDYINRIGSCALIIKE